MPTVGGIAKMDIFMRLPLGSTANQYGDENYNLDGSASSPASRLSARRRISTSSPAAFASQTSRPHFYHRRHPPARADGRQCPPRRAGAFGSVALVLLIACANVANLLLSRATGAPERGRHPHRLGRGWSRVMRQLLKRKPAAGNRGRHRRSRHCLRPVVAGATHQSRQHTQAGVHPHRWRRPRFHLRRRRSHRPALRTRARCPCPPHGSQLAAQSRRPLRPGRKRTRLDPRPSARICSCVSELAFSLMLLIGAGLLARSFVASRAVPPGSIRITS